MHKLFLTTVVMLTAGLCPAADGTEAFSPRVPVSLWAEKMPQLIKDLRRARQEYGLKRFIFVAPAGLRNQGKADLACFARIGEDLNTLRKGLSDLKDVEIGWWCDPTFHAPASEPWQRIMDCDGNVTDSICPLDARHTADFAAKLCTGLRIGRPGTVFIEDDFTLSNHAGMNAMKGCFCPLHMKAYQKKVGKAYTPKEVAEMFRHRTKANEPLRQAWADMSRESLVAFAATVRREIDKVAPETRVCQCQSGFVDIDGDSTEAVARAWAGKTRPLSRIFGAGYFDENLPPNVADNLAHVFWSAQQLPADFELIHETDAFPHLRFYNSSLFLMGELAGAMMAGAHDAFYYCLQYNEDPLEDPGYAARLKEFHKRLSVVKAFRAGAKPVGVRMVYSPREGYMIRETKKSASSGMLTASTHFLTKLGFPVVTRADAPVATLFGNTPEVLSDDEIRELLKGGLFVDGEAATILSQRGFSKLIGVEAEDDVDYKVTFSKEVIQSAAQCRARSRNVKNGRGREKAFIGWTRKEPVFAALKALPGTETWSAFLKDDKFVAPSVTFCRNALGGRVGVMARSVDGPPHTSIYTPRKQELFHNLLVKLSDGRLAVHAPKTPGTFVLAAEKGDEMLVMVNNLAGEPRGDIRLAFASDWYSAQLERLKPDGTWENLPFDYVFQPMVPEFLRVRRLPAKRIRVACIGDSITRGCAMTNQVDECYPEPEALRFFDGRDLSIEGQAFTNTPAPYARLPATLTTAVNKGCHRQARHSAGLQCSFTTSSDVLVIRWSVADDPFRDKDNLTPIASSGIDVYARADGADWRYVASGRVKGLTNECRLAWNPKNACRIHFPLYNAVTSFSVGVKLGATLTALPREPGQKPVVIYGTSITQGASASRPGLTWTSQVARRLDVPVVNLGFAGSGRMELEMADHLATIDASCYVLDCVANLYAQDVEARFEPFVRRLRAARPTVPIVAMERPVNVDEDDAPTRNATLRRCVDRLLAAGAKELYYVPSDRFVPADGEGYVDGGHPNDLAMKMIAAEVAPVLQRVLQRKSTKGVNEK